MKAKKYHPDVNKEKGAESKFKDLSEAYEVLEDENKRQIYDRYGSEAVNQMNNAGSSGPEVDPFGGFGGGFQGFHVRRHPLYLNFMEYRIICLICCLFYNSLARW